MNDIILEIKTKLSMFRKEPQFAQLSEEEWIVFQIDYIIENMGHEDLTCVERNNYFKKIVEQCIGYDEIKKFFNAEGITCFDSNRKMRIFYVFTSKERKNSIVYTHNDKEKIRYITQNEINEIYDRGIRILSEKRKEEYESILLNASNLQDEENDLYRKIRKIALLPEVMEKMEEASRMFYEIVKHTTEKGCDWIHD